MRHLSPYAVLVLGISASIAQDADVKPQQSHDIPAQISLGHLSQAEAERLANLTAATKSLNLRAYALNHVEFKVVSGVGFWWFHYGENLPKSDRCFAIVVNDSTKDVKVYGCG